MCLDTVVLFEFSFVSRRIYEFCPQHNLELTLIERDALGIDGTFLIVHYLQTFEQGLSRPQQLFEVRSLRNLPCNIGKRKTCVRKRDVEPFRRGP